MPPDRRFEVHDYHGRGSDIAGLSGFVTLCVAAFFFQRVAQGQLEEGVRTDRVTAFLWFSADGLRHGELWRLFTYMFAHGGFSHLLWNMYGLILFGRAVEGAIGTLRFVLLYLVSGLAGGLLYLVFNFSSPIPMLGASGAVLGVTVAAAMLFPDDMILAFLFLPMKMRTFVICYAVLTAGMSVWGGDAGGIAHLAHLGGMVGGYLYLRWVQARSGGRFLRTLVPVPRKLPQLVPPGKRALHRCAVCGRTEQDDAKLEFRVCSQCAGGQEYCTEHLGAHAHQGAAGKGT